jgi:hypothetical protein
MNSGDDSPKNEFASFLEDVAQEISQRVQKVVPAGGPTPDAPPPLDDQRRILDWPVVTDRMIDELR